jgi:hypothetical protein
MTPTLPTPTEELEIRQQSEEAWRLTWANCTDLTPKQAFIEGHFLALWCGVLACRTISDQAKQRAERLEMVLSLSLLSLVVAVAWGLMR